MEKYANLSGISGVTGYQIEPDSITVAWEDGTVYVYTTVSAGREHIEQMKSLALAGLGLNTYINQQVRDRYATRLK